MRTNPVFGEAGTGPDNLRGARARLIQENAFKDPDLDWVWFNPDGFFLFLYDVLLPLKYLVYLIAPLALIGLFVVFNNLQALITDHVYFRAPLTVLQLLLFSMLTVNLFTQIGRGIVNRGFGMEVDGFGIRMVLGVVPRFGIHATGIAQLSKRQQLWVHAAPLLIRMASFGCCSVIWIMTRSNGTHIAFLALMITSISFISFFISLNPLVNSNGYKLLSTWLDTPNLRRKGYRTLLGKHNGSESNQGSSNQLAYKAYALASATFWLVLIGMAVYLAATWMETNMSGTGVFLFLLIFLYFVISFVRNSKSRRAEMNSNIQNRPGLRGRGRFQQRFQDQLEPDIDEETENVIKKKKPRWLKYLIALVLLVVAFIPYPYETGGAFTVLPAEQEWIYGETKGIVKNVFHNGNEHLPAGELIAKLSSHDQEEAVQVTVAAIAEQRAKLEELLTTPTKEDIEVAKSNLNTAQTHYKYSSESAKRLEALYKDGNVSLDVYQDEEKQMEVDKMQVVEASANLNKVMAGPHPMEIEAAKSELKRLEEKLKFDQSELEMTDLVMPMDGYLVTRNLKQTIGKYLDEGDMFAVVENTSSVRVEIGIPEADISDVKIGAKVRLKLWAYPDIIVEGVVSEIDRNITEDTFGDVIIVTAIIDNQNGLLQSGMTGFGKVDGGSKFVIVAFTRMIVRFFRVELWSWIP